MSLTQEESAIEAIRRIEEAADTGSERLDLGDLSLAKLPAELSRLSDLRELVLGVAEFAPEEPFGYRWLSERRAVARPLRSIDVLSSLPALERLDLSGLTVESVGAVSDLPNLRVLLLSGKMRDLDAIESLVSLESLNFRGCRDLQIAPDLRRMKSLRVLSAGGHFEELRGLEGLTKLRYLSVQDCRHLKRLPDLSRLASLQSFEFDACDKLEAIPDLSSLIALESLAAGGLAKSIKGLEKLTRLRSLNVSRCHQLSELPVLHRLVDLEALSVGGYVTEVPGLGRLTRLRSLILSSCRRLSELPDLRRLTDLELLAVGGHVTSIPGLEYLSRLTVLDLTGCRGLRSLPDLSALPRLQTLRGGGRIKRINGLQDLTQLKALDLCACRDLEELPDLGQLSQLETLVVAGRIRSVSGLERLKRLIVLDLSSCRELQRLPDLMKLPRSVRRLRLDALPIGDLHFLDRLKAVEFLSLDACGYLGSFEPVRKHLASIQVLALFGSYFDDLPPELTGVAGGANVVEPIRSHFAAIDQQDGADDRECKVLLLGNGRVGKSSIVNLIREEAHDPSEVSTHGIRLWQWYTSPLLRDDHEAASVRLNLWDFGGQDLYHNVHRLFLSTKAVFLVVWDAFEAERPPEFEGDAPPEERRPLQYWFDQIHSLHRNPNIVVIRNKVDLDEGREVDDWRLAVQERYRHFPTLEISASEDRCEHAAALISTLHDAVARELGGKAQRTIGRGRLQVKNALRAMQESNDLQLRSGARPSLPYLSHDDFGALVREHCAGTADAEDPRLLLRYLHDTGVVYHRYGVFEEDMVIVEQRWAIKGIYTLFDRALCRDRLYQSHGRFYLSQLKDWVWRDAGYSDEEQRVFISFMRSCRIAHVLLRRDESAYDEPLFVAPFYLPNRTVVDDRLDKLIDPLGSEVVGESWVEHDYLHVGILGGFFFKLVDLFSRSAVLFENGAAIPAADGRSAAIVEWRPLAKGRFGGRLDIKAYGDAEGATELIFAIQGLFLHQSYFPVDAVFRMSAGGEAVGAVRGDADERLRELAPSRALAVGKCVAISRAQADNDDPSIEILPSALYGELLERAKAQGFSVLIDEGNHSYSRIRLMMQELAKSDYVFVFLSRRYLFSKWCMFELMTLFRASPAGQFEKARIKMIRFPSAQAPTQQPDELIDEWQRRAEEFADRVSARTQAEGKTGILHAEKIAVSIEPCYDWFRYVSLLDNQTTFFGALPDTIYEDIEADADPSSCDAGSIARKDSVVQWVRMAVDAVG